MRKGPLLSCRLLLAIAVILAGVPSGCSKKPSTTSLPAASIPVRGETSVKFLPNPPDEKAELLGNQFFQAPRPIRALTLPIYPDVALAGRPPQTSIVVRIVIGGDGRVQSVQDSPRGSSPQSGFSADFRAAIEEAVRTWEFVPAEIQTLEAASDLNGDGKPDFVRVVGREVVSVYYDVQFNFEFVGAGGRVTLGAHVNSIHKKP